MSGSFLTKLNDVRSARHLFALGGILLLALVLRGVGFIGYSDMNPRAYAMLADDLAAGELHVPDDEIIPVFPLRIGNYGPSAVLIRIFGLSTATMVGFHFIIGMLVPLLAYVVARHFYGGLAGLFAMLLLAIVPLEITRSSILMPHAPAAFWANIGMCLCWFALRGDGRLRGTAVLLAGLLFGLSWLTYESVVFLIPGLLAILCFTGDHDLRERIRLTALIGIGSASVFVIEVVTLHALTGDLLYRLHSTERNYIVCSEFFFLPDSSRFGWEAGRFGEVMRDRLLFDGPKRLLLSPVLCALPFLALISLAWGLFRGMRDLVVPGIWLIGVLLMFNFMTTSFESYKPLPMLIRYLSPLLLPSALLVAAVTSRLLLQQTPFVSSRVRFLVPVAALLMAVFWLPEIRRVMRADLLGRQRATLQIDAGEAVIYTDRWTAGNMVWLDDGVLESESTRIRPFEAIDPLEFETGALVYVDHGIRDLWVAAGQYDPPVLFEIVPDHLEVIWQEQAVTLYRVGVPTNG